MKRPAHLVVVLSTLIPALAMADPPPRFPSASVWHQNIAAAPLHANSTSMINALIGLGGWGNGNKFQIDFSLQTFPDAAPGDGGSVVDVGVAKRSGVYFPRPGRGVGPL